MTDTLQSLRDEILAAGDPQPAASSSGDDSGWAAGTTVQPGPGSELSEDAQNTLRDWGEPLRRYAQAQKERAIDGALSAQWVKAAQEQVKAADDERQKALEALESPNSDVTSAEGLRAAAVQAQEKHNNAQTFLEAAQQYEANRIARIQEAQGPQAEDDQGWANSAFASAIGGNRYAAPAAEEPWGNTAFAQGMTSPQGGQVSAAVTGAEKEIIGSAGSGLYGTGQYLQQGWQKVAQDAIAGARNLSPTLAIAGASRTLLQQVLGNPPPPTAPVEQKADFVRNAGVALVNASKPVQEYAASLAVNPEFENTFLVKSATMAGGAVPYLIVGALGTAVAGPEGGMGAAAALAAAQSYGQTYDEAIQKGASEESARNAAGVSALVNGGLMSVPVGGWLMRIPGLFQGSMVRAVAELAAHGAGFTTIVEAQQFLDNLIAKSYYDPERDLFQGLPNLRTLEGWKKIGEGMFVGAILPGAGAGAHAVWRTIVGKRPLPEAAPGPTEATPQGEPTPEQAAENVRSEIAFEQAHLDQMELNRSIPESEKENVRQRVEELSRQLPGAAAPAGGEAVTNEPQGFWNELGTRIDQHLAEAPQEGTAEHVGLEKKIDHYLPALDLDIEDFYDRNGLHYDLHDDDVREIVRDLLIRHDDPLTIGEEDIERAVNDFAARHISAREQASRLRPQERGEQGERAGGAAAQRPAEETPANEPSGAPGSPAAGAAVGAGTEPQPGAAGAGRQDRAAQPVLRPAGSPAAEPGRDGAGTDRAPADIARDLQDRLKEPVLRTQLPAELRKLGATPDQIGPIISGELREGRLRTDAAGYVRRVAKIPKAPVRDYETGRKEARDYVLERGRATGQEFGATVSPEGVVRPIEPTNVEGKNNKSYLHVNKETAPELYEGSPRSVDLHHNHPLSSSFSKADYIEAASRPAQRSTFVHGHDGSEYWAQWHATPETLGKAYDIARGVIGKPNGRLPTYGAHLIGMLLKESGIIDYRAKLAHPEDAKKRVDSTIGTEAWDKAVNAIRDLETKDDMEKYAQDRDAAENYGVEKPMFAIGAEAAEEPGPRVNKEGFVLKLPFDKWGDVRFDPEARQNALETLRDIQMMPVKKVAWADLIEARNAINEITANLFYYKPDSDIAEIRRHADAELWHYVRDPDRTEKGHAFVDVPSFFRDELPANAADMKEFAQQGKQAIDHLIASRRSGIRDLLLHGDLAAEPRRRGPSPADIGKTQPSGFYFKSGRLLADAPDALFKQGGQAVIDWLRKPKQGVSRAEIEHFQLQEKFGDQAPHGGLAPKRGPVTREEFAQAIAERMFDFKRKVSWLNPERSVNDYGEDEHGRPIVRAFRGPRIPGRGEYFEEPHAFPKRLRGGEPMAAGNFRAPHWEGVLPGTWASWRGSIREVPGWGKMAVGEEGQTDLQQGANERAGGLGARRPRLSEKEYLNLRSQRPYYERARSEVDRLMGVVDRAIRDLDETGDYSQSLNDLRSLKYATPEAFAERLSAVEEGIRKAFRSSPDLGANGRGGRANDALNALEGIERVRNMNPEYFGPDAFRKYQETERSFTPETPLDTTYVRNMARTLLLRAAREDADSVSISTSDTTSRIQNNASAGHFYDRQLKPNLEKELRRLTGDGDLKLEKITLPKALGAPRNEKPYTVWAAKLSPELKAKIKAEGLPMLALSPDSEVRLGLHDKFSAGKTHTIDPGVVRSVHATLADSMDVLPYDLGVGVLSKIEPYRNYKDKGVVRLTFTRSNGSTFQDNQHWLSVLPARAAYFHGPDAIGFLNFDLSGKPQQLLRGELRHELVHALVRSGRLEVDVLGTLASHSDHLGVLDMGVHDYLRMIGQSAPDGPGASLREAYTRLRKQQYKETPQKIQDSLREEAAAHLVELAYHGQVPEDALGPVKPIVDWILSGDASRGESAPTARTLELQHAIGSPEAMGRVQRGELDRLGFYSQAKEAIESWPQKTGTVQQAYKWLKDHGVKDAEIKATGLDKLLGAAAATGQAPTRGEASAMETASPRNAAQKLTKQQIISHLEAHRVEVRESVYRYHDDMVVVDGQEMRPEALIDQLYPEGAERNTWRRGWLYAERRSTSDANDFIDRLVEDARRTLGGPLDRVTALRNQVAQPKWSQYSLDPSNPTYRETVIHLPQITAGLDAERVALKKQIDAIHAQGRDGDIGELNRLRDIYNERYGTLAVNPDTRNFTQGHFSEPNVIAHARTSLQKDSKGKTTFLIDELQSDWGQKLREGGARDEGKIAELEKRHGEASVAVKAATEEARVHLLEEADPARLKALQYANNKDLRAALPWNLEDELRRMGTPEAQVIRDKLGKAMQQEALLKAELDTAQSATPGHPLVNTTDQWTTTAFRRLIRQAVEAGAERIAVVPGKVQADRFNLAKQVDSLELYPHNIQGTYQLVARKGGRDVMREDVSKEDLPNYIGKEMADKLLASPATKRNAQGEQMSYWHLPDLNGVEIGGHGMRATYDGIYPRTLGKILGKLDPAIKQEEVPLQSSLDGRTFKHNSGDPRDAVTNEKGPPIQFHSFPLTDKLKSQVREQGQPMFAIGGDLRDDRMPGERDATDTAGTQKPLDSIPQERRSALSEMIQACKAA